MSVRARSSGEAEDASWQTRALVTGRESLMHLRSPSARAGAGWTRQARMSVRPAGSHAPIIIAFRMSPLTLSSESFRFPRTEERKFKRDYIAREFRSSFNVESEW